MEIIQFEQGFKLHIEINNRASCMSVMGKVFPFEGSPEYIGFWMQDELLPPSEGRHRLYRSHIDFEIRLVNGVEIDQFIKAVNVAKDRLNRYQSLHMRFKDYNSFLEALEDVIERKNYDQVCIFLYLCPLRDDDEAIDEILLKLLDGQGGYTDDGLLRQIQHSLGDDTLNAMRDLSYSHSQFNGNFSGFLISKFDEFSRKGLFTKPTEMTLLFGK